MRGGVCKHGHDMTPRNTYTNSQGTRVCRACVRASRKRYSAKHRDEINAYLRRWRSGRNGAAAARLPKAKVIPYKTPIVDGPPSAESLARLEQAMRMVML